MICIMIWKKFYVKKVNLWREICRKSLSLVGSLRGGKNEVEPIKEKKLRCVFGGYRQRKDMFFRHCMEST